MKKLHSKIDPTTVIIAHRLDDRLWKALESVEWCPMMVIIDTSAIQDKKTIKEFKDKAKSSFSDIHFFVYEPQISHFSVMRNSALRHVDTNWTFFLDSDEWVSEELKDEMLAAIHHDSADSFEISRRDFFLGKELRYGETASISLMRLGKTHAGVWKGSAHEVWLFDGETQKLSSPLFHNAHTSIEEFISKINAYTSILAKEKHEHGERTSLFEIFTYPTGKFLSNYFLKLGLLDGWRGLICALAMSFHSFFMRVKLWEMQNFK